MKYLSICSGIEAATVAWEGLGWTPLAFSEIEAFPRAVLQHHYPDVPLHGDFTKLRDEPWIGDADILVGGTPCQAFSVAGLRKSLDDDRGNLTLEFVRLANAIDDLRSSGAIIVWENVPGVLSVKDNAFGCFLAALVGDDAPLVPPRGKWSNAGLVAGPKRRAAWRILDAQYFGVPQRRRRVFVVASARDDFDPAEVLFEREGVQRHTAPRREAGKTAPIIPSRSTAGGGLGTDFDLDGGLVAHSLRAEGFDASEDGTGRGTPIVPVAIEDPVPPLMARSSRGGAQTLSPGYQTDGHMVAVPVAFGVNENPDVGHCLRSGASKVDKHESTTYVLVAFHPTQDPISSTDGTTHALSCGSSGGQASVAVAIDLRNGTQNDVAMSLQSGGMGDERGLCPNAIPHTLAPVAFDMRGREGGAQMEGPHDTANIRAADGGSSRSYVAQHWAVRRLTPTECERLQGFPDGWTAISRNGKPAADGPRYKALGNSMAVPVMRWIGKRIQNS